MQSSVKTSRILFCLTCCAIICSVFLCFVEGSSFKQDDNSLRYYVNSVRRPDPLYADYDLSVFNQNKNLQKSQQQTQQQPKTYENYFHNFQNNANSIEFMPQNRPRIIKAAVITRYSIEDRNQNDLPQEYSSAEPISIEVESRNHRPMIIHFRSPRRQIRVRQSFDKTEMPNGVVEKTSAEDEPIRLIHEVTRPIIQEIHEQILPRRKVVQELRPVEEEIRTIIASIGNKSVTESPEESLPDDIGEFTTNSNPIFNAYEFEKDSKDMFENNRTNILSHNNDNIDGYDNSNNKNNTNTNSSSSIDNNHNNNNDHSDDMSISLSSK